MKVLIGIFFSFIFFSTFGQVNNDSIINRFVENLRTNGIDTILTYDNACVGCIDPTMLISTNNDSCFSDDKPYFAYILWKKKGLTFVTKISDYDCYIYDTIRYNFSLIWNLYFRNKSKIKKEKIFSPAFLNNGDIVSEDIDHFSYVHIVIIDKKEKVEFEINDFYFNRMVDEKYLNLNYYRNFKTFRKKLQSLINKKIKYIEDKKLIKKTHLKWHKHLL